MKVRTVVLGVMSIETYGGIADQLTNLAVELPAHGIRPIVVVRNPLPATNTYGQMLRGHGIQLWAPTEQSLLFVRHVCSVLVQILFPLVVLDAAFRRKSLRASRGSLWGLTRRLGYAGLDLVFMWHLLRALVLERARVIHLRSPDASAFILWAKRIGLRTVYTEDSTPRPDIRHLYDELARALPHATAVTAVSRAVAESIRDVCCYSSPIRVIANMVHDPGDPPARRNQREGRFTVGAFVRLAPEKDVPLLVAAADLALRERPDILFLIYGDGPERERLQLTVLSLGLAERVVFAGVCRKDDLGEAMASVDLVVLSSIAEGLPVSLLEAMAYAKPVVATAVGGIPEVVEDGVTGFLVARSPRDLADAILTLASDRRTYDRFAGAARRRYLEHFIPEVIVPQYAGVYEAALTAAGSPQSGPTTDPGRVSMTDRDCR